MKLKYIWKDNWWYTTWKIYESNKFVRDSDWNYVSFNICSRVWVVNDNWSLYHIEKIYWKVVYEDIHKWTEVINTQTNEMKYALWTKTIGDEVYIIVKHNQETLAWRYTDCEIITKEVNEPLIDNNNTMNTLDKLIAEEEFSAEVMSKIAAKYKTLKTDIKNLQEDIYNKEILLKELMYLADTLNEWVESKNIELVNEVLNK